MSLGDVIVAVDVGGGGGGGPVGGGCGGAIGGGGGAMDGAGTMPVLLPLLLPPIGPIPNNGSEDCIGDELGWLATADIGAKGASDVGINSSNADIFELCPDCIIWFRCDETVFDEPLGTTPANNPAAIFILREFSASASSSNSGCKELIGVPWAPPMTPIVDTPFSAPGKLGAAEAG